MPTRVVIGTRASALALWQANWVKEELESLHPGLAVLLQTIHTRGDKLLDAHLARIGGKGLFVTEIELALARGEIDLAVHSLKDLPTEQPAGLTIAAVPPREDARDALVSRHGLRLADLPVGATIGTSSLRRSAQLLAFRPDFIIANLRGNLDTRLRKAATDYDGVVLAVAGLRRLNAVDRVVEVLSTDVCLPAVGQGALAIETRADDDAVRALVAPLEDPDTRAAVTAERALLHRLGGGCHVPVGAYAAVTGNELALAAVVAHASGQPLLRADGRASLQDAASLGEKVAEQLLAKGAAALLGGN